MASLSVESCCSTAGSKRKGCIGDGLPKDSQMRCCIVVATKRTNCKVLHIEEEMGMESTIFFVPTFYLTTINYDDDVGLPGELANQAVTIFWSCS